MNGEALFFLLMFTVAFLTRLGLEHQARNDLKTSALRALKLATAYCVFGAYVHYLATQEIAESCMLAILALFVNRMASNSLDEASAQRGPSEDDEDLDEDQPSYDIEPVVFSRRLA